MKKYDFSGWATKNDIRCSDGRTIRRGAFAAQDGAKVPLVWNHRHDSESEVLGHAILENRDNGVYAYCSFNGTDAGQTAKELVQHGDICALSIYANQLKQNAGDVVHGIIREVSLVLAGANKGAIIDSVLEHGELSDDSAEIMFIGYDDILVHSTDVEDEKEDKKMINKKNYDPEEDDEDYNEESEAKKPVKKGGKTVGDVLDTLSEDQKKAVAILVDEVLKSEKGSGSKNNDNDEEEDMKHNVFDGDREQGYLSHSEMKEIFSNAKRAGSLKAAVADSMESGALAHALTNDDGSSQAYGMTNVDYLFPDAKTIDNTPAFIKRETDWVDEVMSQTHHTPFSRVKSVFADITEDQARAKGYIKGKLKKEEVFSLLKRTTEPQTIYKKQKMDKDDIDDITDFSVVAWLKTEMQLMLREETARAILIGDGRLASDDDKIKEDHIRPVYNDADLYTVKYAVEIPANASDEVKAKALMKAAIKARKLYKGSGNPTFFTNEDELTNMLLIENGIGERMYKSEAEVATALRAKKTTSVELMEGLEVEITEGSSKTKYPVAAISVNLADYNIGTNGGAKTDFFDDFDIDYNQYKYLYETRMSGALIKPYSAITFYYKETASAATASTKTSTN